MSGVQQLLSEVDEVEALLGKSWGLADEDFMNRRQEALAMRRRIFEHTVAIGRMGEETFRASAAQGGFHQVFAAARSAMAFHHASWPIVSIQLDDLEYRASAKAMREAYEALIAWTRRAARSL